MEEARIGDRRVVSIHYTLTNDKGEVLDSSSGGEPLTYLHGSGEIVPGLEKQLAGKRTGDKLKAVVPPKEGYGERRGKGPQRVPRDAFAGIDEIEVGMAFDTEGDDGRAQTVWIVSVDDKAVMIDINHPLAGETLNFDVEVVAVRKATAEELRHGHAHGAHGHGHSH